MIRSDITCAQKFPLKNLPHVFSVLFLLLISAGAMAQNEWTLDLKSGINIPTEEIEEAELKTGYGIEGTLSYEVTNYLSAYAGWGWSKFSSVRSFAGEDLDFEETGYTAGIRFNYPTTTSKVTYMVGVGGLYNHIEIEDSAGEIIADSGHGFGTQVETGIIIMLGKHFQFIPYGRYRSLPGEFDLDHTITSIDLRYLTFGIGLSWTL